VKLRKKDLDTSGEGVAHCGVCGERFMGQDRAEIVIKKTGERKIVHADTCYNPRTMEVA
jgi:hypothetical protein